MSYIFLHLCGATGVVEEFAATASGTTTDFGFWRGLLRSETKQTLIMSFGDGSVVAVRRSATYGDIEVVDSGAR